MNFKDWCKLRGIKFSHRNQERPAEKVWQQCQADLARKDREIKDLLDELGVVGDLLASINNQLSESQANGYTE